MIYDITIISKLNNYYRYHYFFFISKKNTYLPIYYKKNNKMSKIHTNVIIRAYYYRGDDAMNFCQIRTSVLLTQRTFQVFSFLTFYKSDLESCWTKCLVHINCRKPQNKKYLNITLF